MLMLGTACLERRRRRSCMLLASLCPKAAPCGGGIPAIPGVLPSEGAASGAGGAQVAALSSAVLPACAGGRAALASTPCLLAALLCLLGQGGQGGPTSCLAHAPCVSTCCESHLASPLVRTSLFCCLRCCCCGCCDCGGGGPSAVGAVASDPIGIGFWGVLLRGCLHLLLLVLALLGQSCIAQAALLGS